MERIQGNNLEEAMVNLNQLKAWQPYRFSCLSYARELELGSWGFYATKPKLRKGEANITIYKLH